MERTCCNIDELDYLARRLDSFDDYERTQYQAEAFKLNLYGIEDFINLTFCSHEVTVITDFADLELLGKRHYLTVHGGGASEMEMEQLDVRAVAVRLINNNSGYVTPYGAVFSNGMELSQDYDGQHFPELRYDDTMLVLEMRAKDASNSPTEGTWMNLPMTDMQIERSMLRAGIGRAADAHFAFAEYELPWSVYTVLDLRRDGIGDLNKMCNAILKLDEGECEKLEAVIEYAKPKCAHEIIKLAESIGEFEYVRGVYDAEGYGRYLIQQSGHFEYDENLEDFYAYEQYGKISVSEEQGIFTDRGYISYQGAQSLEEMMTDCVAEMPEMQMGGMK